MTKKVIGSDLIHLVQLCCKNNKLSVDQIQTACISWYSFSPCLRSLVDSRFLTESNGQVSSCIATELLLLLKIARSSRYGEIGKEGDWGQSLAHIPGKSAYNDITDDPVNHLESSVAKQCKTLL